MFRWCESCQEIHYDVTQGKTFEHMLNYENLVCFTAKYTVDFGLLYKLGHLITTGHHTRVGNNVVAMDRLDTVRHTNVLCTRCDRDFWEPPNKISTGHCSMCNHFMMVAMKRKACSQFNYNNYYSPDSRSRMPSTPPWWQVDQWQWLGSIAMTTWTWTHTRQLRKRNTKHISHS